MNMDERPTCGKGLAENSILPATLGKVLDAMAENLAVHMKALDLTDPNAREEYDAYEGLVRDIRQSSARLEQTANRMAGYRDLPMGKHDEEAMTQPGVKAAFQTFVNQKKELRSLLEKTAERDQQLLEMMNAHTHKA
jgi:hypothetical protein